MPTLGLDIGGANLKAATSDGRAAAVAFPLWKFPEKLAAELHALTTPFADCDRIAVTMTGELADCFATKAEGVMRILDSVSEMASGKRVDVWATSGRFLSPRDAKNHWQAIAAANWHAQATWAGRLAPRGDGLLIDIGSTTTDIIPLRGGVPCPQGKTDLERLWSGELVYTGIRRTPLCAVRETVELRGRTCRIAAELFATMLDAYLIAGRIPPDEADLDTADGRAATVERAYDRLAHMVCCDWTELAPQELQSLAEQFVAAQSHQIRTAILQVCRRFTTKISTLILSGSGTFLVREVIRDLDHCSEAFMVDLPSLLSPAIAESACAFAVATLLEDIEEKDDPQISQICADQSKTS
jgi:probable H4MPT-linked C1 transfer pathway protein